MLAIIKRLFACGLFLIIFAPVQVFAHKLEPAILDIPILEQDAKYYLTLTNTKDSAQRFDLTLVNIMIDQESGEALIAGEYTGNDITVEESAIVPAQSAQTIAIEMNGTNTQTPSSILGLHIVEYADANSAIQIRTGFLALLFIQNETVFTDYQLLSNHVSFAKRFSTLRYEALIKASSEGAAKPELTMQIQSLFGRTIEKLPVNPAGKRVPKELSRAFTVDWQFASDGISLFRIVQEPFGLYRINIVNHDDEMIYTKWQFLFSAKKIALVGFLLVAFSGIIAIRRNRIHA